MVHISHNQKVATSPTVRWLDPHDPETIPPSGVRIDVLTWGGVKTDAIWTQDSYAQFVAWCAKPSKPHWVEERISNAYKGDRTYHKAQK